MSASSELSLTAAGWISAVDDETGVPYYYNTLSGESTWEPPVLPAKVVAAALAATAGSVPAAAAAGTSALAGGDVGTGGGGGGGSGGGSGGVGGSGGGESGDGGGSRSESTVSATTTGTHAEGSRRRSAMSAMSSSGRRHSTRSRRLSALGASAWIECFDEESKRTYYFNRSTKERCGVASAVRRPRAARSLDAWRRWRMFVWACAAHPRAAA